MTTIDVDTYDVNDYRTGNLLVGLPSADLVCASLEAGPDGAVYAFYNGEEWMHIATEQVTREEARGNVVRVVYITEA